MEIEKIKLKIGNYQILPLPTGLFGLDGGAMFGTVPKVLWQRTNPTDELNRIDMEARGLLLKGERAGNIVIDTGNGGDFVAKYGEKLGGKFAEMYKVTSQGPEILETLQGLGVKPQEVQDVILTHLHFDHAGGATTEREGSLVPSFSQAKYWLQKANLETAKNPNLREKASYFPANFAPLEQAGCLNLIEGNQGIFPSIDVLVSHGHTRGHQMVKVSDGVNTLLYCGDVIPTSSHVRLAWIMGYDLDPLTLIAEKTQILRQAAEEGWYLFFEHDPYCDAAKVVAHGGDFAVQKRFQILS